MHLWGMSGVDMELETWFDSNIGRVRTSNQDTVGCFPEVSLFIVADGMGGHAEGEVASRLATEVIRARLGADPPVTPAPRPKWFTRFFKLSRRSRTGDNADANHLRLAVEAANRRVFDEGQVREHEGGSMGTTVVALQCFLPRARASWAYVGDSRLYRARGGRLTLLTADHTLYGEPYRQGNEIPSDLPHTNRLMRAVGAQNEVEVSTGADDLEAGDLFLLCSDGVSGMVGAEAIEAEMTSRRSLAEIGATLIAKALDAGGKDNASVVLVRVRDGDAS